MHLDHTFHAALRQMLRALCSQLRLNCVFSDFMELRISHVVTSCSTCDDRAASSGSAASLAR
jgi:hypothetical protein